MSADGARERDAEPDAPRPVAMVVDSMVFVYSAVEAYGASSACDRVFARIGEIVVPDMMFGEFAEAVRRWVAAGGVSESDALDAARDVESMVARVVPTRDLIRRALELALERGHPVYDAVFVALAERHDTRVVTYDRRMLAAFPERTVSVPAFLAGARG